MKQSCLLLLILSLLLGLIGCKGETAALAEQSNDPAATVQALRYSDGTATLWEEGSSYTMELRFLEEVLPGSVLELLEGETVLLSFTAEEAFSTLQISLKALKKNVPYRLTVDGVAQIHGSHPPVNEVPDPHWIPDPQQPSLPSDPVEVPAGGETVGFTPGNGSSSNGEPPELQTNSFDPNSPDFIIEIPSEGLPSFDPNNPPPEPPADGFRPDKPDIGSLGKEPILLSPDQIQLFFLLKGQITVFSHVRPGV